MDQCFFGNNILLFFINKHVGLLNRPLDFYISLLPQEQLVLILFSLLKLVYFFTFETTSILL